MDKTPIIITAGTILKLLLNKHSDSICVPECKTGKSWDNKAMHKIDLWVMKKSYTQPQTIAYEIKVSRQDFLRDDKWQEYLPYCTDFYFVAPAGIIDPTEVPGQAGLFLTSKNGTMLYCKKKSPHRPTAIPASLLTYIVMSRAKIVASAYTNNSNSSFNMRTYWEKWLTEKKEKREFGYHVSKRIRELYAEKVTEVEKKQDRLEGQIERLENVETILKELGFDSKKLSWDYKDRIKDRIKEISSGLPEKDIVRNLEEAVLNLNNTIKVIRKSYCE